MATSYLAPGVYVEEVPPSMHPIEAVGTSTAAFLGEAPDSTYHIGEAIALNCWGDFIKVDKEGRSLAPKDSNSTALSHAVYGFFQNSGSRCYVVNVGTNGSVRANLRVLEPIDEIKIIAAPGSSNVDTYDALLSFCEKSEFCVAILDAPETVTDIAALKEIATLSAPTKPKSKPADSGSGGEDEAAPVAGGGLRPRNSTYGAFYFPWLSVTDELHPIITLPDGTSRLNVVNAPPSGHIAGIYARTDRERGVHKAPANQAVRGALGFKYWVTRQEQEVLNPNGVNCIRKIGSDFLVWGARTTADSSSEYRYISVRRLTNMIKESILLHTCGFVFEPHDYELRVRVSHCIEAFLKLLWGQGALMGQTAEQAFFVKCDGENNPPEVVDAGRLVVDIGIAPVKPAEFVIFRIGQTMGAAAGES